MAAVYPEGTIVTGGLSKDRSSGGYRFGVSIMPEDADALTNNILKVAGSTFSCVAAPIQYAAIEAYAGNGKVERHIRDSAKVNGMVAREMASLLSEIPGVKFTSPDGGFYFYLDFNEYRDEFFKLGFDSCDKFCEHLLEVEHIAMLPASALLIPEDDFSVRCSFVDFDGGRVLRAWRRKNLNTPEKQSCFVRKHCPLVVDGVKYLKRYLEQVREGKRPIHFMTM